MNWEELKEECLHCERCGLCTTRTNVVFGDGVPNAEVLFVGEGPGQHEDEQGLPFVGRSGALLDSYLHAIDLDRKKNVFIANIVKCRPPKNRDPLPEERPPVCLGCGSSSGCCGRKSSSALAGSPRSRSSARTTRSQRSTVNLSRRTGCFLWGPSTPPRCCATPTTSRLPLRILPRCGKRSVRSAPLPIKKGHKLQRAAEPWDNAPAPAALFCRFILLPVFPAPLRPALGRAASSAPP